MSALLQLPAAPANLPSLPIYRFTLAQYRGLIEEGILGQEDPLELLEGLLVVKGDSTLVPAILVSGPNGGFMTPMPVRRFTIPEYHRMIATGILLEDEPVELLEGWLVTQMSRNPPHDAVLALVLKYLQMHLPADWHTRCQSAVTTDVSEPEPDVAVVRGDERAYLAAHPRPRDVGLVVEVADTTLARDRQVKGPLYARAGIPIYWIVNLSDMLVEVYTEPTGPDPIPAFHHQQNYTVADQVPFILDGAVLSSIPVRELLP